MKRRASPKASVVIIADQLTEPRAKNVYKALQERFGSRKDVDIRIITSETGWSDLAPRIDDQLEPKPKVIILFSENLADLASSIVLFSKVAPNKYDETRIFVEGDIHGDWPAKENLEKFTMLSSDSKVPEHLLEGVKSALPEVHKKKREVRHR